MSRNSNNEFIQWLEKKIKQEENLLLEYIYSRNCIKYRIGDFNLSLQLLDKIIKTMEKMNDKNINFYCLYQKALLYRYCGHHLSAIEIFNEIKINFNIFHSNKIKILEEYVSKIEKCQNNAKEIQQYLKEKNNEENAFVDDIWNGYKFSKILNDLQNFDPFLYEIFNLIGNVTILFL